jgi:WD40 repeat protein
MSQVTSVEFSADDKHLITGSLDKSVRIWKLDTDELLNTLIGFPGGVRSAKFAPSGKQVAAASEDEISFWDPFKPEKLRSVSLETEKKRVHCVCYSPDGKILATADADFCIQLLDAETGKVRAVLKGHEKAVWYVTFAPDGTTLVSGGSDGVVKTWDVSAFSGPISK